MKNKGDKKLHDVLRAMINFEYKMLQIDFMSIFYAITREYKIQSPLEETLELIPKLMGFTKDDPKAFVLFDKALGYLSTQSKRKKGRKLLEKTIKLSPNNPLYMMELLKVYQQEGQIKKARSLARNAEEKVKALNDKGCMKDKLKAILNDFSKTNTDFEAIKRRNNCSEETGVLEVLSTITMELSRYLKGTKSGLKSNDLDKPIEDCLKCLEWVSMVATASYLALQLRLENQNILEQLKNKIVWILGWIPEPLEQMQSPNFLSPKLRKEAWLRTLGFDVLNFRPIESVKNARYLHVDGDKGNDNPETHAWFAKEFAEQRNIVKQHEMHNQSELKKIQEHLEINFGKGYRILHQKTDSIVHIDINIIPPTKDRNYGLLISSGMSERPMNPPKDVWKWWGIDINKVPSKSKDAFNCDFAELVIKIPPDWPLLKGEIKNDEYFWVIEEMFHLINYVHSNNQWFWDGHTMRSRNDDLRPFSSNTKLTGWLFLFPSPFLPKKFTILRVSPNKMICFLQLIPLYIEEIQYAMQNNTSALLEKFDQHGIADCIDLNRPNVIKE